jgi:hypothetical protein
MASTYSSLKFELIATGEQSGAWGDTTNTNIGTAIEQAIVGMATLESADFTANVATLTLSNSPAAQDARALCLNIAAGAVSAAGTVNVPAIQKPYIVINGSSYTVTVKVSGQTGVAVPAGKRTVVYNNGTDVGNQIDWLAALDVTALNVTTVDTTNLEVTNIKAKDGTASITLADSTGIATFSNATVISTTDNTNAALRITQLGTGNALLVEDSSNPDSTPFVIDAGGKVVIGNTSAPTISGVPQLQLASSATQAGSQIGLSNWITSNTGPVIQLAKSRSGAVGTQGIASSSDLMGTIAFYGDDGTAFIQSASISAAVDGTPGTNDMPGRLVISTTADGASSPTERMRIDSSGNVGIGTSSPNKSSSSTALTVNTGTAANYSAVEWSSGNTLNYHINANNSAIYHVAAGTRPWIVYTNGSESMRIDSSGNVGVGTSTPTSMLQTAGTSAKSAFKTPNIAEVDTISATAATGTINFDVTTQSVLFYTSNATGNWTVNFRGSSGTTLNTVMQTGESISATFLVTQGSTAYYNSAVTIDGTSVTPKWQGGSAPTSGNASSVDCYTYVIQKTGSATYVVLASQTKFA